LEQNVKESEELRYIAGLTVTGSLLAAEHWFPWWRKLHRLEAYTLGVLAILLGQGIWLKFDQRWRRSAAFAAIAGAVVYAAWGYDTIANARARMGADIGEAHKD
jgi:hypothetical protein